MSGVLLAGLASPQLLDGPGFREVLDEALEGSRVSLALMDDELRYTWVCNPLGVCLSGSQFIGKTDDELYGPSGAELTALKKLALTSGERVRATVCLRRHGTVHRLELTITPYRDDTDAVVSLLCLSINTTAQSASAEQPGLLHDDLEQRALEHTSAPARTVERLEHEGAERRRAEESLRLHTQILSRVYHVVVATDLAGKVLYWNHRAEELLGWSAAEALGRPVHELIEMPGLPATHHQIKQQMRHGEVWTGEEEVQCKDGTVRSLLITKAPLLDASGALGGLVVVAADLHERKAVGQRLAAAVVHEVNKPLQAIESCLHLASRLPGTQERERYLSLASEEIHRIGGILRQFLEMYRPIQRSISTVALNALVERVLLLVDASLTRHTIAVECVLAPDLPPLSGRSDELTQVLLNLIFNAVQAMGHGGRLLIRTSYEAPAGQQPYLRLTVADTGAGIEPAISARIFEPFFTTRADGSGLGLAVSQRIVAAHGGRILVESKPGEGTVFTVEFPL